MRIDSRYSIRTIAGEKVIFLQGRKSADMTKIVSFNSTAEFLFNSFIGKDFALKDVSNLLIDHFGIDEELAENDAKGWVEMLSNLKIIME